MKILIAADSRGDFVTDGGTPWTDIVKRQLALHDIELWRENDTERKRLLATIWGIAEELESKDRYYDLIILQTGIHEFARPYSKSIWKRLISDFNEANLVDVAKGSEYLYRDKESFARAITRIRRFTKTVCFVGMQSGLKRHPPHWTAEQFNNLTQEINTSFRGAVDDVLYLPAFGSWAADPAHPKDYVHYTSDKCIEIADLVVSYIRSLESSLVKLLETRCGNQAIEVRGVCSTLEQLLARAKGRGATLAKQFEPGSVIGIAKRTSLEQLECFIGAMLSGLVPIILPHPSNKVQHRHFLKKLTKVNQAIAPALCIADTEDQTIFSQLWQTTSQLEISLSDTNFKQRQNQNRSVLFSQLSSGTTTIPKVISVSENQLIRHTLAYQDFIRFSPVDHTVVSWLPLYHDMGLVACFLFPLLLGAPFVLIHPFDWLSNPRILFEKIEQYRSTHIWLPNFAFCTLSRFTTKHALNSLEQVISCSEVTHLKHVDKFKSQFAAAGLRPEALRTCYAMAENVFAVSQSEDVHSVCVDGNEVVSCGKVIPGNSLIIRREGEDVTESQTGEIYLRSSYDALTTSGFGADYYPTGDIGFIKDNELFVLGRIDDMIISFGRNLFPYEIEESVFSIEGILAGRVACFGVVNSTQGTEDVWVCAEIPVSSETSSGGPSLQEQITRQVFEEFGIQSQVTLLPAGTLTKTSSGKLNRKACREFVLRQWRA